MSRPRAWSGRRGFTLAEMIAAIALLAVFSVFIVQLFAAAHNLAGRTDRLDSAVLCARNLAEAWQAGTDKAPVVLAAPATAAPAAATTATAAPAAATTGAPGPDTALIPVGPLSGATAIRSGQTIRLGFDSTLQPVAADSGRAAYLADLNLMPQPGIGTELLRIVVIDPEGAVLFELTAARLTETAVTP